MPGHPVYLTSESHRDQLGFCVSHVLQTAESSSMCDYTLCNITVGRQYAERPLQFHVHEPKALRAQKIKSEPRLTPHAEVCQRNYFRLALNVSIRSAELYLNFSTLQPLDKISYNLLNFIFQKIYVIPPVPQHGSHQVCMPENLRAGIIPQYLSEVFLNRLRHGYKDPD
jgi:hypothetical protein